MQKGICGNAFTFFTRRISKIQWWFLLFLFTVSMAAFLVVTGSFPSVGSLFSGSPLSQIHAAEVDPFPPVAKEVLDASRIAVCLVGGARRFELTGPSILENVLTAFVNADLFLHCPVDENAYKLSFLNASAGVRVAAVRLFYPQPLPETEAQTRVLAASNSPNGVQGLLQYFNLVEGCLEMISSYQQQNNFTYDWIVRTRVDGYWSGRLGHEGFIPGRYVVPAGSSFGGLNDRLGIGDLSTSAAALARLSLIPRLDESGLRSLNSERAFKAQLASAGVPHSARPFPFCVISDRTYDFPPDRFGVPVAAVSSPGPLSGAKCRPCLPACSGACARKAVSGLSADGGRTEWSPRLRLCNASAGWADGWQRAFDLAAGKELASARRRITDTTLRRCVGGFDGMRRRAGIWESPPAAEVCRLGLRREDRGGQAAGPLPRQIR